MHPQIQSSQPQNGKERFARTGGQQNIDQHRVTFFDNLFLWYFHSESSHDAMITDNPNSHNHFNEIRVVKSLSKKELVEWRLPRLLLLFR